MSEVDFQTQQHRRLFIPNFLSPQECKELEFIHKCSSTVGYRPNVFSTTLSHLIATNSSHFIIPFIPIRERLKDKLEEFFKCEFELFIEFTGLISWSRGASIGWHSDDNRPYLKQRHFSVVLYLNTYGKDFNGGLFHFQDGEPATIMPAAGDVVMYTADDRNIHSVDEVVQFYCWEGSALQTNMLNIDSKVVKLLDVQREKISGINSLLLNDVNFASRIFCRRPSYSEENGCIYFNWTGIVAAIAAWEDYVLKLSKQIHLQLPYWRMQESLYNVQIDA